MSDTSPPRCARPACLEARRRVRQLQNEIASAVGRRIAAEAALHRYGVHLTGCPQTADRRRLAQDTGTVAGECDCGLADIMAGGEP